jgi:hypothetical protein
MTIYSTLPAADGPKPPEIVATQGDLSVTQACYRDDSFDGYRSDIGVETNERSWEVHALTVTRDESATFTTDDIEAFDDPDPSGPSARFSTAIGRIGEVTRVYYDPLIVTLSRDGREPTVYTGSLYLRIDGTSGATDPNCQIQGTLTPGGP